MTFLIFSTGTDRRSLNYEIARFWSKRLIAVKFSLGIEGACWEATSALVLGGLATTRTLTVFLEYLSSASPCSLNIFAFTYSKSFLSIPGPLGLPPTNTATSVLSKATSIYVVGIIWARRGKAQSLSSSTNPFNNPSEEGSSINYRMTFWVGPNIRPDAIKKHSTDPT